MPNYTLKTRTLSDDIKIDDNLTLKKGEVLTADDVMRITGVESKATALKRMNCADEKTMLAKKGVRAGYEYSQENLNKKKIRTDSLLQFCSKEKKEQWIKDNRPFYDSWFRLAMAKI
jgi:hypothetical protein